jgi:hypothetical protein
VAEEYPGMVSKPETTPIYEGIGSVKQKNKKSADQIKQKNKKSADQIKKMHTHLPADGEAVKGARQAFILTLDSLSRPTKSQRERSETKFSEASFPVGSVFFWLGSPPELGHVAQGSER